VLLAAFHVIQQLPYDALHEWYFFKQTNSTTLTACPLSSRQTAFLC
jgi:hypothetical protein